MIPLLKLALVCSLLASLPQLCQAMTASAPIVYQGMVPTTLGSVHYQAVGLMSTHTNPNKLLPIVGFHMAPRSSDEYKEVMAEAAAQEGRVFVAMDQLGFGHSSNPQRTCTLDEVADSFVAVLDHLQIQKCIVTGSLTPGCCLALSLASRYPQRVCGVVCSNLYHYTNSEREKALQEENLHLEQSPITDNWNLQDDGSHISKIWDKRSHLLSPELNTRVTLDEFQYLVQRRDRYAKGVHMQEAGTFPLANACWNTLCPVLCINGADGIQFLQDKGMPFSSQFRQAMTYFIQPPAEVTLQGGGVHMLNENAEDWWNLVQAFAGNLEGTGAADHSPFYDQQLAQQKRRQQHQQQHQQQQRHPYQ